MKNLLFFLCVLISTNTLIAQNCPEPKEENYKKVMSSAFANDFKDCPVIIKAEYLKDGFMTGWRKPSKINKMYFFQCVADGESPKSAPLTNETIGDFFVVDKKNVDVVLSLKKGDKIKATGKTFTQNYFGMNLHTFFIVEKIEKIY